MVAENDELKASASSMMKAQREIEADKQECDEPRPPSSPYNMNLSWMPPAYLWGI